MTAWLQRAARARARMGLDPLAGDRPDESFETIWRRTMKRRVLVVVALLACWAVALEARLFWLQIVKHDDMLNEANRQQREVIRPPAGRGDILDRNGRLLASSVDGASIGAAGNQIEDDEKTAAALCQALGDCTPAEVRRLAAEFAQDKWIKEIRRARELTPNQIAAVAALDLRGIYLIPSTRRWYPNRDLASHLIGFVGVDAQGRENKGLAGVELKFDDLIRGREGRLQVLLDARGHRMSTRVEQAPTVGATVELTIDSALQYAVERALHDAVQSNRAKGGTAVVMDPWTGEVLANASLPTFNPNAPTETPVEYWRNRAVQDVYEPGSTFKIVTASAALEEGVLRPADLIDCSPGFIRIGSRVIPDTHRMGVVTFEDVLVHSSNVGAIKAGQMVGAERLGRYIKRFGFGDRLNPDDFLGESAGRVFNPASLDASGLASVSMGYQISVTALQMAVATSAVANGGHLVEPHLVRATIRDGVRTAREPKALRQAILPETAAKVTSIMEEVVRSGTGKAASLDRYQVAGKTGTAEKVENRQYNGEYNASFVGFVPSRKPALTIVVVIDAPRAGRYYGGQVAAPVFKRIAEAALRELGVPPTINPVPPAIIASASPLTRPAPVVGPATRVPTVIPARIAIDSAAVMPDVRGLSARAATRALTAAALTFQMAGDGFVIEQDPQPGLPIPATRKVVVRLSRAEASGSRR